jgi:hypothetical protein
MSRSDSRTRSIKPGARSNTRNCRCSAGTTNILTELNTEIALFTAQDALVQVKFQHLQALVDLYQALGGGWRQQRAASHDAASPPLVRCRRSDRTDRRMDLAYRTRARRPRHPMARRLPWQSTLRSPRRRDVPVYLEGLGNVQAFYTAKINSRVDGQLERVGFVEGQLVKKGDLLAQIDPRPLQAALEQAARDAGQG